MPAITESSLIEPIEVTIEPIDKTNTQFSGGVNGKREPMNHIARSTAVILNAQVAFGKTMSDEQITQFKTALGPDETIRGYMIFLFKDLKDKGITLKRGDKVTKMGQLDVDLYLSHGTNDPAAHLSAIGFTLVKVFFNDRNPVGGEAR